MEDKTPDIALIPRRKFVKAAEAAFASQVGSDSHSGGSEAEAKPSKGKRRAADQIVRNEKKPRTNTQSVLASADTAPRPRLEISTQVMESTSTIAYTIPNVSKLFDNNSTMASTHVDGMEDMSDLTSLSSDEHPPSPDDVELKHKLLPKPFPMFSILESTPIATTSKSGPLKAISSTSRVLTGSTSAIANRKPKPKSINKEFGLGTYVWVLVQPETLRLYDESQDEGKAVWWPGKVHKCRTASVLLEVKLFGEGLKTVEIPSPSKANIISQSTPFTKMKFKDPKYVSSLSFGQTSSRKNQDSHHEDTNKKWKAAVKAMRNDEEIISIADSGSDCDMDPLSATDDDDLPVYVRSVPSTSKPITAPPKPTFSQDNSEGAMKGKGKKKGKGKGRGKSVDIGFENNLVDEPDVLLEIPGELVLARDKAHASIYWPARIEAYVPAAKPTQAGKYTVTWVDNTSQDVPREWFYIFSDVEFATCKVGRFKSLFGEDEDDNDEDELKVPKKDRSPSPVLHDPPPSQEDFKTLPIREQLAYTKEVLHAILDDRYAPSRQKHDDFIKGGKWRKNVSSAAAMRGLMSPADVDCLHKLVQKWCLRDVRGHTMDLVEEYSQEPVAIDDIQSNANPNHHEANNSPSPVSGVVTALEPTATDGTQQISKSSQLSDSTLLTPAFNRHRSAESTPSQALTSDVHTNIAMLEPTAVNNVQQEPDSVLDDHHDPAIRGCSPSSTEGLGSSPPPEMPPSSLMSSLLQYGSSQSDIIPSALLLASEVATSPPPSSLSAPTFVTESTAVDICDEISELTAMEEDQSLHEVAAAPKERVFVPFDSLTHIAKIEYCSNILVPEAVRQILLWRSGDRTEINLLSPEEEQALYDKGSVLLTERDWVFDVMRLRQTKIDSIRARKAKLLQAVGGSSSMSLKSMHSRNKSSSRPKRNVLSQNYQE